MFNRKYAVRDLALEIMRQDSWLTLLEATKQARGFIDRAGRRRRRRSHVHQLTPHRGGARPRERTT